MPVCDTVAVLAGSPRSTRTTHSRTSHNDYELLQMTSDVGGKKSPWFPAYLRPQMNAALTGGRARARAAVAGFCPPAAARLAVVGPKPFVFRDPTLLPEYFGTQSLATAAQPGRRERRRSR